MASARFTRRADRIGPGILELAVVLLLLLFVRPAHAQSGDGIYWHIDPNVRTCSMVIDPALTQDQWHTFVQQAGAIIDFKTLGPATPLGKGRFTVGLVQTSTPVDQHDPAWINTFTHPDADCPLGDEIVQPSLRAAYGVSNTTDVIGFWSTAPRANYGIVGGAVRYGFLQESLKRPAVAVTASVTSLTGVPDFNFNVVSLDVSASKRIGRLTPYLGVRHSLAVGTETTSKVDLSTETVPITQGIVGAFVSVWKVGLAAEYDVAPVNTFALRLGFHL